MHDKYHHFSKLSKEKDVLRNTRRWRNLRNNHITKNSLCYFCGRLGEEVHHVSKDKWAFYNDTNLVTLCKQGHMGLELLLVRPSSFKKIALSMGIDLNSFKFLELLKPISAVKLCKRGVV